MQVHANHQPGGVKFRQATAKTYGLKQAPELFQTAWEHEQNSSIM
jgi:hypothetical protein